MAASPQDISNRTSSLLARSSADAAHSQPLPNGSCNYREPSAGPTAPKCGCQRFWPNSAHSQATGPGFERAWCFCGHHACFHRLSSQQNTVSDLPNAASLQSSELGRPQTMQSIEHGQSETTHRPSQERQVLEPHAMNIHGLGIHPGLLKSVPPVSMNARLWEGLNAFARNQEIGLMNAAGLPSTVAPSLASERPRSPTSVLGYQCRQTNIMAPPLDIPRIEPAMTITEEYSATEVATPSVIGTPDFRHAQVNTVGHHHESVSNIIPSQFHSNATQTTPHLALQQPRALQQHLHLTSQGNTPIMSHGAKTSLRDFEDSESSAFRTGQHLSLQEIRNLISSLGTRLDSLENVSFSHIPIEAVQDKFEFMEGRILDLEHWRADCEEGQKLKEILPRQRAATSSPEAEAGSSSDSEASFDSHAAAYTEAAILATLAANSETAPYLAALESRITELESSAMPSFSRPWQVEVVLLPWGRDLSGIWFSSTESTQHSIGNGEQTIDEWAPSSSGPRISFKSTASAAWTTESIQAWADETQEWLSPKACGPSGVVYQRLSSCGFVQNVTLTASNADHIASAIAEAFAPVLDHGPDSVLSFDERIAGLAERFVPLRKVRKSSRLRFLKRAEMITPALWTAEFLRSSVCMKLDSQCRRLYVTSPDAYIQPLDDAGWTWPKLRQWSLLMASGSEREVQESRGAIEACWSYNDRLDRPARPLSTFSESLAESHASQPNNKSPVELSMQPLSPGDPESRSAPIVVPDFPKRRVVSADSGVAMPLGTGPLVEASVAKRQRLSVSPEVERKGAGLTPRWSREPPSPFTADHVGDSRSQLGGQRQRSNTPFAYATPHSHSTRYNAQPSAMFRASNSQPGTEPTPLPSDYLQDEWQGVDEVVQHGNTGRNDVGSNFAESEDDDGDGYGDDDSDDEEEDDGYSEFDDDDDNDSIADSV